MAAIAAKIARDPPDPNFMELAEPTILAFPVIAVDEPGITQEVADAYNAFFDNLGQEIGFGGALLTSLERAQGAVEAGDAFWETEQMRAAALFATELAALIDMEPGLRENLVSAIQAAGFPGIEFTEDDIVAAQDDLAVNGPTDLLADAFTELGLDNTTIDEILDVLIEADPVAGSFPEVLTDPRLIGAFQDAAQSLDEFARSNSPPPPPPPPSATTLTPFRNVTIAGASVSVLDAMALSRRRPMPITAFTKTTTTTNTPAAMSQSCTELPANVLLRKST